MPPRTCIVTLTDSRGIRHSVEVKAESLFEAAGLALHALRSASDATGKSGEWVDTIGPATKLDVEVREPVVRHTITVQQLERYIESTARTPADSIRKERLRSMLTKPWGARR
jgi:hypothetical protein